MGSEIAWIAHAIARALAELYLCYTAVLDSNESYNMVGVGGALTGDPALSVCQGAGGRTPHDGKRCVACVCLVRLRLMSGGTCDA